MAQFVVPAMNCPVCGEHIRLPVTSEIDRTGPKPVAVVTIDGKPIHAHFAGRHPEMLLMQGVEAAAEGA